MILEAQSFQQTVDLRTRTQQSMAPLTNSANNDNSIVNELKLLLTGSNMNCVTIEMRGVANDNAK